MSQLESWDPKPASPRRKFAEVLSRSRHNPPVSGLASIYPVWRGITLSTTWCAAPIWTHARRDHSPGLHWVLTGYDNQAAGVSLEKVNRLPSAGAVVAHRLGATASAGLPNFVALPNDRQLRNRFRYTLPRYSPTSNSEAFLTKCWC